MKIDELRKYLYDRKVELDRLMSDTNEYPNDLKMKLINNAKDEIELTSTTIDAYDSIKQAIDKIKDTTSDLEHDKKYSELEHIIASKQKYLNKELLLELAEMIKNINNEKEKIDENISTSEPVIKTDEAVESTEKETTIMDDSLNKAIPINKIENIKKPLWISVEKYRNRYLDKKTIVEEEMYQPIEEKSHTLNTSAFTSISILAIVSSVMIFTVFSLGMLLMQ